MITTSNLIFAFYTFMDNLLWLNSVGVLNLKEKAIKINKISDRCWLISSVLSLVRDLYELMHAIKSEDEMIKIIKNDSANRYMLNESSGAYTSAITQRKKSYSTRKMIFTFLFKVKLVCRNKKNHPLLLDTVKNTFDLLIPLSALEIIKLSPGVLGLFGFISSIISLFVVWDSNFKLVP